METDTVVAQPDRKLLSPTPTRTPAQPQRLKEFQEAASHPLHLLWVWMLPQLLLLVMNLRSFGLVWDEMAAAQKTMARVVLGGELLLLAAGGGIAYFLRSTGRRLDLGARAGLLGLAVSYLWYATAVCGEMIPASVTQWILPSEDWLYYQHILVMPSVVLCLVGPLFTGRESSSSMGRVSIAVAAGISMAAVLFVVGIQARVPLLAAFPSVAIDLALVFLVIRGTIGAYVGARRSSPLSLGVFSFVVALFLPLAGLALNAAMPFPTNFQSVGVYALTALNGVLLCLPNFRSIALHRAVWLAQAVTFPFSVYFFVLFLPYLGLSVFALLFLGAGCLMWAPTALFFLHGGRLLDGWRNEVRDGGRLIPTLSLIAAVCVMPVAIAGEALLERRVLSQALDFAYDSDPASTARFTGNRTLLRLSLQRLRDRQSGINLPFVSDFYSAVVFNGLSLPDDKIAWLSRLYFGEELPKRERFEGFGRNRGGGGFRESVTRPQTDGVSMTKLESASTAEGASVRTRVTIEMHNAEAREGEFVAPIQIPTGVLVSGFGLRIGEEMVPGRIFEKKTALWVYQKIRDVVRRDPGLLIYTGPESMELRVFPLAANETRTVEIEFLSAAAAPTLLRIGEREVKIDRAENRVGAVAATFGDPQNTALLLPPAAQAQLAAVPRKPYLHFIVERSAQSAELTPATLKARLLAAAQRFPQATDGIMEFANYETVPASGERLEFAGLAAVAERRLSAIPARGGFLEDHAVKRALVRYHQRRTREPEAWASEYPIIVVIGTSAEPALYEQGLEKFAFMVPDVAGYWRDDANGDFQIHRWESAQQPGGSTSRMPAARPVAVLKCGEAREVALLDPATSALLHFSGQGEIAWFDAAGNRWSPISALVTLPGGEAYSRGLGVWMESRALGLNPSPGHDGARQLIASSRAANVMVPESSFIVVESSAQWKMLAKKEDQKLSANQHLEMEATPEPGSALLLCMGGSWLLGRRWRSRV